MDYDQQIQAALLRQKNAQTGFEAPQGQMVGGRFVAPNALQYIAAGLRGVSGARDSAMAGQEAKDLTAQKQKAMQGDMQSMIAALRGKPAETVQPLTPNDDEGNVNPPIQMPAKAGSMDDFYRVAAGSQFPQFQQMGMQGALTTAQDEYKKNQAIEQQKRLMSVMQNAGSPQAAIAAGVPADVVKAYYEAPSYGKSKVQFKDVGGQLVPVDEYGNTPTGVQPLSKTGNPFSDMVLRGADGGMVPNAPLVGVKTDVARAGKPVVNVTNKIENKAAENIAGQVGPLLKESASAAEGAVRTLDAAGRIVSAIDKGNVIAGPLANTRVTVRQAAQLLGVGGKDNAEVLANTRSTIRGLAEMTLQGRKQMSGQGAITESESKLAEKAMSGDISDLTPAEIKQLAQASARAAQWTIQTHKTRSDAASKLPGMGGLMPFFNTPAMPGNMPEGFKVIE